MSAGHVTQNPRCSTCGRTMRRRRGGRVGWTHCGVTVLDIQPIPAGQEVCFCPGTSNHIWSYSRSCLFPEHRARAA